MRLEKTKNTKRNILYGVLNKFVTLLFPFIVRTVLIKELGADYLGLDSLFVSILQVLNLSELGFGTAIVYNMYKPIAENDTNTICALLRLYRTIYKVVGIAVLLIGLCLVPFLPELIRGRYPEEVNLYLLYYIYLFNTVISYMLFAYKSAVFNAFQRVDIITNINMVTKVLMNLAQLLILFLCPNYYLYLIILPLCTLLNNLLVAYCAKKYFPQYVCMGHVSAEAVESIKKNVAGLMVFKLCGVSRNSFDSIFISAFLGLTFTAIYSNYYYVISALTSIMLIIYTSISAGIGNSVATESVNENYKLMCKIDYLYMLLGGWLSVFLLCLYQPFMRIWVGTDLMFPFSIVILFVLYFYVLKIGDIRAVYVEAAGLWWENKWRCIMEAITNVLLNYILGKMFGVYGIISATLISLVIFNIYGAWILFNYYFKNRKLKEYWRDHMLYAIISMVVGVITYGLCSLVYGEEWFILIVRGIICCITPPIMYFFVYRNTKVYAVSVLWLIEKFSFGTKLRFLVPKGDVKKF